MKRDILPPMGNINPEYRRGKSVMVRLSDREYKKLVREYKQTDAASLSAFLRLKLSSVGPIKPVATEIR